MKPVWVKMAEVPAVWDRVRPLVEKAVEHADGRFGADDVLGWLKKGTLQLWIGEQAIAITEVVNYAKSKRLVVQIVSGELEGVIDFIEPFSEWAKEQGCEAMEASGRRGWERVLPGFERVTTVYRMWL
jgi:hypothetical protein